MAENLEQTMGRQGDSSTPPVAAVNAPRDADTKAAPPEPPTRATPPIHLPNELLVQILEYVSHTTTPQTAQTTLASCCLLSRQWYTCAVPFLYAHPHLYGANFDPFVRSICPSINVGIRHSPLAELVKRLDMSGLVHQGSKSVTARLLGRVKGDVESFVAPVASFGSSCMPPLGKCLHLQHLDLSLVSESPALPDLLRTVSRLDELRSFKLPRSAGFGAHYKPSAFPALAWPPKLENLSLSGGIDAHFLHGVVSFPQTLKSLTLEHCPQAKSHAVMTLLRNAVRPLPRLEELTIRNMPRLGGHALDGVCFLLPNLRTLGVSVDYISEAFFDEGHFRHFKDPLDSQTMPVDFVDDGAQQTALTSAASTSTTPTSSQLHTLILTNSGNPGVEDKISPIDIMLALDEGTLPHLRVVRVAKSLRWHAKGTKEEAEALADALEEAARPPGDGREGGGVMQNRQSGVWMFDDSGIEDIRVNSAGAPLMDM
jgi:hypothetical protein